MKLQAIILFFVLIALLPIEARSQNFNWIPTEGPYATTIFALDTSFGDIFAGTNSGLYLSTNGGSLWTGIPSVPGIVNDISRVGSIILSAGSGGINISIDSGKTWLPENTGFPLFPLVYSLKNVHDTLYASLGDNGFYYSTDTAKHWSLPTNDARGKAVYTMIATGSSLIFAEGVGILRSTDNGFSWNEPDSTIASQAVHVFIQHNKTIFAGTDAGIFTSTDDGVTWNAFGSGLQPDDIVISFAISSDAKTFYAGTKSLSGNKGIYRSRDGGSTWQQVNSGLLDLSVNTIMINGSEIFCGTTLGISETTNSGDSWQTSSNGLPTPAVTTLEPVYDRMFAGTSGSYLFNSSDAGDHWIQHSDGLTRKNINSIYFDGNQVFAGTDAGLKSASAGGFHRSTDNGITWVQSNFGMPLMSISSITKYGTSIYVSGDSGLFGSTDEGKSWKTNSHPFTAAKFLFSDNDSLYAIADSAIWAYTDNSGWNSLAFPKKLNINSLARKGKYLYAGTDSGIYRDSLSIWKLISGDTLSVLSLYNNFVFIAAGTKTGIYISSDDGKSWQYQQSAGQIQINSLNATGTFLYAGTTMGVMKASIVGYSVKNSRKENPLLLQVTNPSGSQAMIRYSSLQRGKTSINCYDLLGRKIDEIFQGESGSAENNIEWNTSLIPNGTYIIRLVSGGDQASAIINVVH